MTTTTEQQRKLPDVKRWKVLYPAFIDARKTLAEGRRIGRTRAVEGPTPQELAEACTRLGLPAAIEPGKAYPREFAAYGRVRVCLRDADGALLRADVAPSRRALMLRVAETIPSLPSRNAAAAAAAAKGKRAKKKGGATR